MPPLRQCCYSRGWYFCHCSCCSCSCNAAIQACARSATHIAALAAGAAERVATSALNTELPLVLRVGCQWCSSSCRHGCCQCACQCTGSTLFRLLLLSLLLLTALATATTSSLRAAAATLKVAATGTAAAHCQWQALAATGTSNTLAVTAAFAASAAVRVLLPRLVLLPANLKGPGVLLLLQCRHSMHLLVCTLTTQAALAAATALTTLSPLLLFLPGWCSCRHCCSCLRCICSFCCTCHDASIRRRLRLNCFASTGPGSSRNLSQEAMPQTQAC